MRICIATHLFPVRSETFVREHAIELVRRGANVSIVAASCGHGIERSELDELSDLGIQILHTRLVPRGFGTGTAAAALLLWKPRLLGDLLQPRPWNRRELITTSLIAKKIASVKADVLHVHFGTLAARLNRLSRHVSGVPPMITSWHGYDANIIPKIRGSDMYLDFFRSNGIHTIGSCFMRNRLLELGAQEASLSIVPMGIDLQKFAYIERSRLENAPLRLLSVGRLTEVKGHAQLIEAVHRLAQRDISVQLRIVGEGDLRETLERLIRKLSLQETVVLIGAIQSQQVVEEMHSADVFVLTGIEASDGRVESQGVVYAEAQATGLPVIASVIGGVPDSLLDGQTGLLCQPGDVEAIARAIERFVIDPALIRTFGVNGRRYIEENFSVSVMASRFELIYERLCSQNLSRYNS